MARRKMQYGGNARTTRRGRVRGGTRGGGRNGGRLPCSGTTTYFAMCEWADSIGQCMYAGAECGYCQWNPQGACMGDGVGSVDCAQAYNQCGYCPDGCTEPVGILPSIPAGQCRTARDCRPGQTCRNRRCVNAPIGPGAGTLPGGGTGDNWCETGVFCNPNGNPAQCLGAGDGAFCQNNPDIPNTGNQGGCCVVLRSGGKLRRGGGSATSNRSFSGRSQNNPKGKPI